MKHFFRNFAAPAAVLVGSFGAAAPAEAKDELREIVRGGTRILETTIEERSETERARIRAGTDMYREDSRLEGRRDDNYTRRYTTDSNNDVRHRQITGEYGNVPQTRLDRSSYGGGYSRRGGSAYDRMQGQERTLQSSGELQGSSTASSGRDFSKCAVGQDVLICPTANGGVERVALPKAPAPRR